MQDYYNFSTALILQEFPPPLKGPFYFVTVVKMDELAK